MLDTAMVIRIMDITIVFILGTIHGIIRIGMVTGHGATVGIRLGTTLGIMEDIMGVDIIIITDRIMEGIIPTTEIIQPDAAAEIIAVMAESVILPDGLSEPVAAVHRLEITIRAEALHPVLLLILDLQETTQADDTVAMSSIIHLQPNQLVHILQEQNHQGLSTAVEVLRYPIQHPVVILPPEVREVTTIIVAAGQATRVREATTTAAREVVGRRVVREATIAAVREAAGQVEVFPPAAAVAADALHLLAVAVAAVVVHPAVAEEAEGKFVSFSKTGKFT